MTRPIRILELRTVRGSGGGPEKTILQGAARNDPGRFAVTVCYLRNSHDNAFHIDEQAAHLNLDYQEIHERHSWDLRIWIALRRLVRDRRIDIIHAHEYKSDFLAFLLARCEPVIPLGTTHGWTGHTWREKLYYLADKRFLRAFPLVIAVSDQIRQTLRASGIADNRIRIIRNAIDSEIFRRDRHREAGVRNSLGISSQEVVIGAVGRLEPQKRFDILLEAFAKLRPKRSQLRLLIVGDGGKRASLQNLIDRFGLSECCHLLGNRTDIVDLQHAFDLFVQSSDYEGTSNALLEAMALETPVVATAVGGTAELIEDGVHGLLIPPGDPAALAHAIAQALDDPIVTNQRRQAARRRVELEFSFDHRMQAVEAIYEELMTYK
jgi:glycosyltransferase involved in cell wall biosynthesis